MGIEPTDADRNVLTVFVTFLSLTVPILGYVYRDVIEESDSWQVTFMLSGFIVAIVSVLLTMLLILLGWGGDFYGMPVWKAALFTGISSAVLSYGALGIAITLHSDSNYSSDEDPHSSG